MSVDVVLLDVDFTLLEPRAVFDGPGYAALGATVGAVLDATAYDAARTRAVEEVFGSRATLDHDADDHERFAVEIVRSMGAGDDDARQIGRLAADAWNDPANFALFADAAPAVASLRRAGLTVGLVSNTHRELPQFIAAMGLDVDFALSSREHGRQKPCPTIFAAALERAGADAGRALMVGDSPEHDVEGARAAGIRAVLLDRHARYLDTAHQRIATLAELPPLVGVDGS